MTSAVKALSTVPDFELGLRLLFSRDELEQSDGIDWLLGHGLPRYEEVLEQARRIGQQDKALEIIWRRFPRIFLYYGEMFWEVAKYLLNADGVKWRARLEIVRRVLERESSAESAESILGDLGPEDQCVVAAFLAVHPRHSCRAIGMKWLKPAERWDILLAPSTHSTVVRELVEVTCKDCPVSYIKAMFLLLRNRLRSAGTPLALNHAFEILKIFYGVPLFLEAIFFKALLSLHRDLNTKAEANAEMAEVGRGFESYFDDFRKRICTQDVGVSEMHYVPLPVQRKLARDGYFVEVFICHGRDPIALEAVPHALHRSDVIRFFKSSRINKLALQRMGDDRDVMREHSLMAALCRNPKADPRQVRKFMPLLGVTEFKLISENKDTSNYARAMAKQFLTLKAN